jgi:nickel/cobalt transporter (NiCoT) family protein
MELSGIVLMVMLGLRHGFDPDHIAIIDGVSVRYATTKPLLAKWTGTLFALGHGTVVTCIAVMISRFSHSWNFPESVWSVLDWVPGLLLIFVGILNLHMLKKQKHYHPKGWKMFFIPEKLKNSSHPLAIVLIGILFAMVFDTNTQAAAWAYTATTQLNTTNALLLGCSFSFGMVITDTLDSRILFTLMLQSVNNDRVLNYRKSLGWVIVHISFIVGGYKILVHLIPSLALEESVLTLTGIAFFSLMIFFYAFILYAGYKKSKKTVHGN